MLPEADDPETVGPESADTEASDGEGSASDGEGAASGTTADDAPVLSVTADARRERRREVVRSLEARGGESRAATPSSADGTDSEGDAESLPEAGGSEISTAGGTA